MVTRWLNVFEDCSAFPRRTKEVRSKPYDLLPQKVAEQLIEGLRKAGLPE